MENKTKLTSEDIRRFAYLGALQTWEHWHNASLKAPNNNFIKEEEERWSDILSQITEYVF